MEKEKSFLPKDDQYHNEDYIRKVFTEGDRSEIEKIKKIHNFTQEQVDLFCDFAVLRRDTLAKMKLELEQRMKKQPRPDKEELELGAYEEQLEPQVRETVLKLRQKGYATDESGFGDFDGQKIGFEQEYFSDHAWSTSLQAELAKEGIELIIEANAIKLKFSRSVGLPLITETWSKIEKALPDLGRPAQPCRLNSAKSFREKHAEL